MKYPLNIRFIETQRFRQTWIWILLAVISGAYMIMVGKQALARGIFADNLISDASLALLGGILFLFLLILYTASLKVKINNNGIFYRYIPFHWRFQSIKWDDVERVYVRKYDAISEYGGWAGVKYGSSGKGYIMPGKFGLQLELRDERRILLSTQKPDELEKLFSKLDFSSHLPPVLQEM